MVIIASHKHKQLCVRNEFWGLYYIYSLMTIKSIKPFQYNRIKVAQKFSAFLLLICCSITNFMAPANSEKTMAVLI